MAPLETLLFDMGGTLDGRGGWRERSWRLFLEAGLDRFSHAHYMAAFDYADAQSQDVGEMPGAGLRDMLRLHIGWQLEALRVNDPDLACELVDRFASGAERAADVNRQVLATLRGRGYRLGLVSNACGNAAGLCEEFGYSASLSAVVDSHWFGRSKPDPSIFTHALALLDASAERTGFVGDSLDHDIRPAKRLGMTTFWVVGDSRSAPATGDADFTIESVSELPECLLRLERGAAARSSA